MSSASASAVSYKKKDGSISVSADSKYLFWIPSTPPNASPAVTVPIAGITNLQQTPASSERVALKVLVDKDNYVFNFTSASSKKDQENITDALRNIIATSKASAAAQLVPAAPAGPPLHGGRDAGETSSQSAAMAIAKAVSSKAADEAWYDDDKLKSDFALQKSLVESNKGLKDRFNQALTERPESVSISQFTSQFWSARLHLLRAHAIEKAQKQGEYNVLPEIRFTRRLAEKDGDPDIKELHITKEQIKLIFKQYPVVREAYNENVPPMDPNMFWQRFFSSRLLKKLKGERVTQQDPPDAILDRYLDRREAGPGSLIHIPHFIDLEGNEQNHSQRKGNRPDQDMRPSGSDKVPILRVLNNLSEKMLSHVAPEDGEAHAPIGLDEETFEQLRLRDLAMVDTDTRVRLNVQGQQRYSGRGEENELSKDAQIYAQQDPQQVLSSLRADINPLRDDGTGSIKLDRVIGFNSDDDSDSEDESPTAHNVNGSTRHSVHIGSHAAMMSATSFILKSIKQRRTVLSTDSASMSGLSQSTFDTLAITHNTTTEFLHYFWSLFLSGDGSRTAELAQLVTTLDRSLDRINAVAATAEEERKSKVDALKRQMVEYEKRTGKRRRLDLEGVGGGKMVIERMVRPTVIALKEASEAYRKALEAQTREMGTTT